MPSDPICANCLHKRSEHLFENEICPLVNPVVKYFTPLPEPQLTRWPIWANWGTAAFALIFSGAVWFGLMGSFTFLLRLLGITEG